MQGAVMLKMMKLTGSEEVVLSGWRVKSAPRYKGLRGELSVRIHWESCSERSSSLVSAIVKSRV